MRSTLGGKSFRSIKCRRLKGHILERALQGCPLRAPQPALTHVHTDRPQQAAVSMVQTEFLAPPQRRVSSLAALMADSTVPHGRPRQNHTLYTLAATFKYSSRGALICLVCKTQAQSYPKDTRVQDPFQTFSRCRDLPLSRPYKHQTGTPFQDQAPVRTRGPCRVRQPAARFLALRRSQRNGWCPGGSEAKGRLCGLRDRGKRTRPRS